MYNNVLMKMYIEVKLFSILKSYLQYKGNKFASYYNFSFC